MLRIALGFWLPAASAMCLINGTTPEVRQNLVNPNGETYPLGIYISNYPASDAVNRLAGIIIEEVLGINASLFSGGGTLAAMQALTGCANPGAADPQCGSEVTYHHVNTEAWVGGYRVNFEDLQKNYPATAVKDLASLGYVGLTSLYFSSDQRAEAFAAKGLPLEYYQAWDSTWNKPWEYFDPLASVNTSHIMSCSLGFPSGQMELYLQHTGDTAGIAVDSAGTYSAVCLNDAWWIAPNCRGNHSHCVMTITGGGASGGWGVNEMMQKATAWGMPLAVGVAASWGDYTQLPLAHKAVFYWWTPDPTFLDLEPMSLVFPAHDALAFSRGQQSTQSDSIPIRTMVSRDLGRLAPKVELFLANMRLDLDTVNKLLSENSNNGEAMSDTVCRWVRANEAEWQSWIPDATKCFPGFGLFDEASNAYVLDRDVPEGKKCLACPSGKFSAALLDSMGSTYVCKDCPYGTAQASGGQQRCEPCGQGEYQDKTGQFACERCPLGFYEEGKGARECTKCPPGSRTLGRGSSFATDCGCDEGRIDVSETGALDCIECQEGLLCPVMATRSSLLTGSHELGREHVASVAEGFYVTEADPLEAFKCGAIWQCPGGQPNSCAGGREGTPCAECPQGRTWSEGTCNECEGWRTVLWAISVVCVFLFLTVAYYLMTSKVTAKASVLFTTTCAFGMLVGLLQSIGIIGMMTVDFPVHISGFLSFFQILLLDLDSFGFACFAGAKTEIRYVTSVLFFPAAILWLASNHAVSQLVPRRRWDWTKTASCIGQVLQVSFSTMSTIALAPLMCYSHPNGQQSLLKYPNIICGSAEHDAMLVVGISLLVLGVFGFLAVCTFAAIRVPYWSASEQHHRVRCFRFLVFRFRLDSWWFGVPLLCRGPLISLPIVLFTDYQAVQSILVTTILCVFLVIQALAWPWKVPMLNALDSWMSFCILVLVAGTALYVGPVSKGDSMAFINAFSMMIMAIIFSAIGFMILAAVSALLNKAAMGGSGEYAIFNLKRTVNADSLAEKMQDMAELVSQMDQKELEIALDSLSVFDTRRITNFMTMTSAEILPADTAKRFSFGTRVSSASFTRPANPAPHA